MTAALVLALAGCSPTEGGAPPRVDGTWEVYGWTAVGTCKWERATWTFGEATVVASVDALCGDGEQHAGCTARAVSPAGFDAATGRWLVERPIAVRSDTTPVADEPDPDPDPDLVVSACASQLEAGPYAFTKVRGEDWKWSMSTPSGETFRLLRPNADHPEFVSALRVDPPADLPAEPPSPTTSVWGPYRVDKVIENGTTEDYRKKMERAAKALERGCTVTDAVYDFRSPSGAAPPTTLAYTEVRNCDKGGLGKFRNALTATVPVEWAANEGGALLVVPPMTAEAGIVRIQTEAGSGRPPSQWMADGLALAQEGATFLVAVTPPKGKNPGPPPAIQLTAVDGRALHLVPAP